MTKRTLARELAAAAIEDGQPLAWFETLYQRADGRASDVPWADQTANPNLIEKASSCTCHKKKPS